ncbi:MAG: undecaprenyldiphospho-muramoylpentapeptide beta-N-acetylglucosaminyltransferase [Deltaproteobacteria bacterium]|nr:undecaprenyldiphospho-muramoylpentapeptide beta-N-acetylglucosaminyltransferase [Deltaproteobacteria bacterium]
MASRRLMNAGGGTGGHLFPAIAVCDEIVGRGGVVRFVGTAAGLEARVLPAGGYDLQLIRVSGLKRVGAAGFARGVLRLPAALWQSRRLIGEFRPDVVIGVGGYASGPVVLAAALAGRATAIMEQNSIPGVTNRVLGRVCRRVYLALEPAREYFPPRKTLLLGNPVRRAIREAASAPAPGGARPRVLAVGGSQGAHVVNEHLVQAVKLLYQRGRAFSLLHQTGAPDRDAIAARYRELDPDGTALEARAFVDDMATAYRDADVVVGRAGATTIAEVCAVGRPALLVPFPFAAADHQEINARVLERAGAATVLRQQGLTPEKLAAALDALLGDAAARARMGAAARALGHPDAARDIVDDLERLVQPASAAFTARSA